MTLASLAVCLLMAAQSTAATATISGRVVEAGTTQPVRRAIVTLTGSALGVGRSAVTDDAGQFAIARVPDGDFALSVTRPGFLQAAYGASRPGRAGTPISIRGGASRSDISVSMTHGSALAGVIRDPSGDPGADMRVEAIRIQHLSGGDRAEKLGEGRANDRGEFRIFGLPAGDYVLAATPSIVVGGMGDMGASSEAEIDAKLNALRSRSAQPAPGGPPSTPAPNAAREKGYAMPAVFYPGAVTPGEAVVVTLGANDSREGLDFAQRLSHAATVDGNVVAARGATVPPQLQLALQGSGPQLPVFGGSLNGPSVRPDPATHSFRITNVPPGHYRLIAKTLNAPGNNTQIMSSGGALPKIDTSGAVLWGAVEFDATGEDIGGITLTVQPAPAVAGHLVAAADGASKAPASLAGTRVSLEPMPDGDRRSNGLSSPIAAVVDAKGAFAMPAVIPGAYRVTATVPSGWWLRSAVTGGADVLDGVLTVDVNGVSDLALTISDRHSSVAGTLTTGGGAATEYFLVAFSADKTMWRAPSRRVRSTRPATSGTFDVADLPPGQYYLAALKDLDAADLEDPAFLETLIPAAALVTITEGQKTTQDLRIGG